VIWKSAKFQKISPFSTLIEVEAACFRYSRGIRYYSALPNNRQQRKASPPRLSTGPMSGVFFGFQVFLLKLFATRRFYMANSPLDGGYCISISTLNRLHVYFGFNIILKLRWTNVCSIPPLCDDGADSAAAVDWDEKGCGCSGRGQERNPNRTGLPSCGAAAAFHSW
jgi:hypothetical protein